MRKLLLALLLLLPLKLSATEVIETITPKGFKIWSVEDHSLPIVSINITFNHAGSSYDPAGKYGLASLISGTLNEGAGDIDGLDFRKELESKGIYLTFSETYDHFQIGIKTLNNNLDRTLELTSLALTKARFENEAISTVKSQIISILAKQQENPEYVAQEKWREVVFAGHPYGRNRMGSKASLSRIKQADLKNYTKTNFTKSNIMISAAGDFDSKELGAKIDRYFNSLPVGKKPEKVIKEAGVFASHKSLVIPFDIPQSFAVFGFPGVKRDTPEFFPAFILNYIIGGGSFESRLMTEVREKRGLAYSINTELETLDHAAYFVGYVATRQEKMNESLQIVSGELIKLREEGITEEELEGAKKYLMGSFAIGLDSNDRLARFLGIMQAEDLGLDYINKRNSYIQSVTKDDVDLLVKKLINPDKLVTVVIGK